MTDPTTPEPTIFPHNIRKESDALTISEADCPFGTYAHVIFVYTKNITKPPSHFYYCFVCDRRGKATANPNGTFTLRNG
jgi:hypothetical protein